MRERAFQIISSVLILLVVTGLFGAAFGKPLSVAWYKHRGRTALREREGETALEWLERAQAVDEEDAETHFLLARCLRRLGKFKQVEEHLDQAESWGWPADRIQLERLLMAAQGGQLRLSAPKLYAYLKDRNEYGDDGPEVCECLVNGYFLSYQFGLALPVLDAWQKDYPDDAQCYMFRGLFFENRSNPTKAVNEYRKALELAPKRIDVRMRLAQVLRKSNQFEEAVRQFEFCRSEDSFHPEVLTGLGQCYRGQGRLDDARAVLRLLLDRDPDYFDAQLIMGQLEETDQRPLAAIRWLRPACLQRPSDREARYSLARSLQVASRDALDACKLADDQRLGCWQAIEWGWARLIAELMQRESERHFDFVSEAQQSMSRVQVWTDVIRSKPDNVELRFKIGMSLMKYDNPQHGLGWLLSVLDLDPDHAAAHRALAGYYKRRGNKELAARHTRQADGEIQADQRGESSDERNDGPETRQR